MNRRIRIKLGITAVFALLLFFGVISAIAEPDYISECGDCHSINSGYTMSSNSTGEANVGVPFTLRIVAQKPQPGGTDFYLSVQYGWADNDNFTFTPAYIKDNDPGDLTPSNFIITSDFTFTPKSSGNNTIRAWCAINGGSQYIDIPINVLDVPDETSPIVDSPSDIDYVVSTTGHSITWTPYDEHPSQFNIQINGVVVLSGGWNGQPIVINVDYMSPGTYEYTLTVIDIGGNPVSDIVMVTVTGEITASTTTTTTTDTPSTTTPEGNPGGPGDNDEALVTNTFSLIMVSTGIIVGILILLLILDRWRS